MRIVEHYDAGMVAMECVNFLADFWIPKYPRGCNGWNGRYCHLGRQTFPPQKRDTATME